MIFGIRRGTHENSDQWMWSTRFGRLQLKIVVHRHRSHLPDRWVIQPNVIYDRNRHVSGRK